MKLNFRYKATCSSCQKHRVVAWETPIGRYCKKCITPKKTKEAKCSRLDDAEAVLKSIGCPECGTPFGPSHAPCSTCKGSGLHPDASAYFERWK